METTKRRMEVAIALIWRGERVLVALRPDHVEEGNHWEFPGGKLEKNETAPEALVREVREELGVAARVVGHAWSSIIERPERLLVLHFFHAVVAADAEPKPLCAKKLAWRTAGELAGLPFCSADAELLAALQRGAVAPPNQAPGPS